MRFKNALTKYYIAEKPEGGAETNWLRLAAGISEVSDETEEDVEEVGFYDGDGTPEKNVNSIAESYSFTGLYDDSDEAHKLIRTKRRLIGEDRIIMFKKEETFGQTAEGEATITDIKYSGGEATAFPEITCTISWNVTPTVSDTASNTEG